MADNIRIPTDDELKKMEDATSSSKTKRAENEKKKRERDREEAEKKLSGKK